ncbi:MAG TPA: UDP-N-acetylglucosamine 3-dehydrogenase [Methanocella sp.]|uniref:UDP-N-acetylglucosamine 3-dehydrogenase n=1 Tax=Methanocella sp. TaxID=2052833 RepID=UPI002CF0C57A|nr:UDP-N-acetylglucosamine 3-dehydrogenase [Methanocella sp.]HTY90750.1 UDP-N-acetylglucosamine 3-dehydrogenase [Methanocella sp.]
MKVGVIGAGAMGQNHIRTYCQIQGVELAGIADVDKTRVEALSKQYGTQGFTDYREMLKLGLDAVSVVVPTTLHRRVALDVISSGTNLLVEKPISDTVENARAIVDAARLEGLKLMVGHIERFNPAVIKMKSLIDSMELGKVVSINTRRVGPYNPRIRDVGVILDIGVHDIDIISYLYNSSPQEVYAIAGNDIHSQEDHASILLRFAGNRAGVVETNWLTPHKTRTFTVIGTEAVGYGDYMEQKIFIHDKEWVKEAKVEKKEPLRNELEHFMNCCKNGHEPSASGEDGIMALMAALASIESYKSSTVMKITQDAIMPEIKMITNTMISS